jgi:hypothetical protein
VTVAQRHGLGDQSIQDHPRPRLSRRVVRTVIRSEATEFHYERRQQPLPRIDPWRDQLDGLLLENEGSPRLPT